MSKMLFVQSEDYWGYDASSFDEAINFYKFTWVVRFDQYNKMTDDEKKRLYPCALFYVAGVTDNHNFLTLKIAQDTTGATPVAKVSGMEGTKRRTRRYTVGSDAQYSVGSYALQAAPAGVIGLEEIKEAVESGSTSEGSFLVSGFLDDAASVASAVNYEGKSAESFAAPITEPSGSSYEPADPTASNPSTEGPSESELITMSAEIEYAELGDESYPIVPNTTGQDSSFSGHGVPQWYGAETEDSEKYNFTFTVYDNTTGEEIDDGEVSVTAANETEARNEAMRMLEEGGLDDEEFVLGAETKVCGDCGRPATHSARGGTMNRCDRCWPGESYRSEGGRLRDIRGKFMNRSKAKNAVFGEVMSQQMGGYYRTGIVGDNPPVGQDISRRNPLAKAKYFVQPGVQNSNSGKWSKGPNFQQARKIAKGVAWDTVQDMGLAAESESIKIEDELGGYQCSQCYTGFEDKDQADYCCTACYACGYAAHVGFERAQKCCPCDCDETGGGENGTCQEVFGSETFCADCGTKKYRGEEEGCGCGSMSAEMEYAELGEELYPVVPNSEGGNTALDSGYGVPQWYGSAEDEELEYVCDICGDPAAYNFQDSTIRFTIKDDDFEYYPNGKPKYDVSEYYGALQNDFYCEKHAKQNEGSDFYAENVITKDAESESVKIEDELGGYQCSQCYTGFEDKDQADYCCTACYACGYAAHVGFERAQKCCPCDCDETGGGPNGTCQEMFEGEGNTSKPFFWNQMPKNEFITKSGEVAEWMMQYEYGPTENWWVWKGDGPEDPDDPDKWGYVDTGAEGRYLGVIEFIKKLNGYSYDEVPIGNLDIDDKFLILSLERMKGAPSMEGLWTNEPTISEDYDQITFDAPDRKTPSNYIFNRDNQLEYELEVLQERSDWLQERRKEMSGVDYARIEKERELVNSRIRDVMLERKSLDQINFGAERRKITETLEEASPTKGVLVAPALAAIAGLVAGIFYARR